MGETGSKTLTNRQRAFIEAYLTCWNASEAARVARYKNPRQSGSENLSKPDIKAEIQKRITEMAMCADEVLARLSDHASASLDEFLDDCGNIDIGKGRDTGKLHLVKKYKTTTRTDKEGGITKTAEIELHDPQAALVHMGRHYGLFTDNFSVDWREEISRHGIDPDEALKQLEAIFASKMGAGANGGGGDAKSGDAPISRADSEASNQ